jgi:hypothetical protein
MMVEPLFIAYVKDTRIWRQQNKIIIKIERCEDDRLVKLAGDCKEISCGFRDGESVSLRHSLRASLLLTEHFIR